MSRIFQYIGKFLFKFRAVIAVPFFILLVLLSRPVVYPGIGYLLLTVGIAVRIWAAGYIGVPARKISFATRFRITNGPYSVLRHPLYIGNFLLVVGVVILYNPPLIYALVIVLSYIAAYGLIIVSEQAYIKKLVEKRTGFDIRNCYGETWTIIVLDAIIVIHMIVPKNILL